MVNVNVRGVHKTGSQALLFNQSLEDFLPFLNPQEMMMRNLMMKPVDLLCYRTSTFLKNLFYRIFLFGLFAG